MCVVLVPNIGLRTTISNTTQFPPQHFRNFMFSTGNVRGTSVKYWSQNHHIQYYTNTPTALQKLQACPLGMCVALVPNIGFRTTIYNTTQIFPQHFINFMCVHGECSWCQCQIPVLEPLYITLHKYSHSTSETSCVCSGIVHGVSTKYWSQNHHIQHYTNMRTALQKLHVCPLVLCMVLLRNIGLRTTIYNTTQIFPQHFRNFMCVHGEWAWCQCPILVLEPPYITLHKKAHSTSETSCVSTGNVRGTSAQYWSQNHHIQHYTNTPTALQKLHACPRGMCVVLVPNIGFRTTIYNITQIFPQQFINFMCVQRECAWCQCQILVLEPPYITLHKYVHSTLESSCVSTGNVRGASTKYWSQNYHIQHYTISPTALQKLHVFHWECAWYQCQILVLEPPYSILHKYSHSTSETSGLSTGNVRGASAKYWFQNHHI